LSGKNEAMQSGCSVCKSGARETAALQNIRGEQVNDESGKKNRNFLLLGHRNPRPQDGRQQPMQNQQYLFSNTLHRRL